MELIVCKAIQNHDINHICIVLLNKRLGVVGNLFNHVEKQWLISCFTFSKYKSFTTFTITNISNNN